MRSPWAISFTRPLSVPCGRSRRMAASPTRPRSGSLPPWTPQSPRSQAPGKPSWLVPPSVIWRRTLDEVRALGSRALRVPRRGPRGRARLRRGAVRRDGAQVRRGDPLGPRDARPDSRRRLSYPRPHRPAGHRGGRPPGGGARLQDRAGAQGTISSSTAERSFSAASTPSPSRRCWARRWPSRRRSSIRARRWTCS